MAKSMKLNSGSKTRKPQLIDIKKLEDIKPDLLWNYIFRSPDASKDAQVNITYSDGQKVALKSGSGTNDCDIQLPFDNPERNIQDLEDGMAISSNGKPTSIWTFNVINVQKIRGIIQTETRNGHLKNCLAALLPYIEENEDGINWKDAEINIKGPKNQLWTIRSGVGRYEIEVYESLGGIEINPIPEDVNDVSIKVPEINKLVLAKEMVKHTGNEASTKNPSLKKLYQAAIAKIGENSESYLLRNASMFFYDDKNNVYQIVSGGGKYHFVISADEKGNPKVIIPITKDATGCCVM